MWNGHNDLFNVSRFVCTGTVPELCRVLRLEPLMQPRVLPELHRNCTGTAPELHRNCTGTAPRLAT
jgi:hypothetical protein